jgi:DNA-binding MarR family transcriptional regulator
MSATIDRVDERGELLRSLEAFFRRVMALTESTGLSFLVDVELSFTQVRTLLLLACLDSMPIHSVADHLGLSVHTAGRTIDHLVETGLVERREDPNDRRVKLVSLTPRGLGVIDEHLAARRRALQTFIERLPEEHATALTEVLRPILAGGYLSPGWSKVPHRA